MAKKPIGWRRETARHSLAARGIKSGKKKTTPNRASSSFRTQAGTILQQLGGNRFIAMTGAKQFIRYDDERKISFKIGRNAKNVNYVEVRLNSMDTYDVSFYNVRAGKFTLKSKADGVYNDQLEGVFTEHTGMYTRL